MELQPEASCSLVDTDLSCDVTESREFMARIAAEQAAAMAAAAEEARLREEAAAVQERLRQVCERLQGLNLTSTCTFSLRPFTPNSQEQQAADAQAAQAAAEVMQQRAILAASLPPEPPAAAPEGIISCRFNLPDGAKAQRRFRLTEPLQAMYNYVESCGAGGLRPATYRLVMQYPRRVFAPGSAQTLHEAGLSPGQNVFLLEVVSPM